MASSDFFIRHDMTHCAVESVLRLEHAFYGLLGQGWDLGDFEEREQGSRKARALPAEAYYAEVLVGAFELETILGEQDPVFFNDRLHEALPAEGKAIRDTDLGAIRALLRRLLAHWSSLEPGARLELPFPAS
jgi:hypothetical protein